jgi:hypothetical protein
MMQREYRGVNSFCVASFNAWNIWSTTIIEFIPHSIMIFLLAVLPSLLILSARSGLSGKLKAFPASIEASRVF